MSCTGTPNGPSGVISSRDVQPTVPVPTYPAYPTQFQPPPGQMQPIIYDSGLIQAVTNAQNFIAQTFPGARLLESHNVSLDGLRIVIVVKESVLHFPRYMSRIIREVKFDVYGKRQTANGKRQTANFCRLSSALCTVESRYLYLQWIVRDTFLFLYDLFKGIMKRIEKQR